MKKFIVVIVICGVLGGLYYAKSEEVSNNINNKATQIINTVLVEKRFKSKYKKVAKKIFGKDDEKGIRNIYNNLKDDIYPLDYKEILGRKSMSKLYSQVFDGEVILNKYSENLLSYTMDFDVNEIKYNKVEDENIKVIPNPKMYIGNNKYKILDEMYLVYNEKPIVLNCYRKEDEFIENNYEYFLSMVLDSKGKIKTIGVFEGNSNVEILKNIYSEEFFAEELRKIESNYYEGIDGDEHIDPKSLIGDYFF